MKDNVWLGQHNKDSIKSFTLHHVVDHNSVPKDSSFDTVNSTKTNPPKLYKYMLFAFEKRYT